jgi:hypothetical protein
MNSSCRLIFLLLSLFSSINVNKHPTLSRSAAQRSRHEPLLLRVEDHVLEELRGGQERTDDLQQVVVEREQGAVCVEARVRAHAECEQQGAELAVGEGGEVAVVVEREVLDEQRGHEAGAERVDRERHCAREGVTHLLVQDVNELRDGLGARPAAVRALVVAIGEAREDLAEDCGWARDARVHEVRDHVAPVCGNGTGAALSHGEPVWEDTQYMEQEAKLPLLRLSNN